MALWYGLFSGVRSAVIGQPVLDGVSARPVLPAVGRGFESFRIPAFLGLHEGANPCAMTDDVSADADQWNRYHDDQPPARRWPHRQLDLIGGPVYPKSAALRASGEPFVVLRV